MMSWMLMKWMPTRLDSNSTENYVFTPRASSPRGEYLPTHLPYQAGSIFRLLGFRPYLAGVRIINCSNLYRLQCSSIYTPTRCTLTRDVLSHVSLPASLGRQHRFHRPASGPGPAYAHGSGPAAAAAAAAAAAFLSPRYNLANSCRAARHNSSIPVFTCFNSRRHRSTPLPPPLSTPPPPLPPPPPPPPPPPLLAFSPDTRA